MRPGSTGRTQVLVEGVLGEGVSEAEALDGSLGLDKKTCLLAAGR